MPARRDVPPATAGVATRGTLALAAAVLVGYNAALNLVPFPAAAYVPANLALAAGAVLLGRGAGLSPDEVGLGRRQRRGLLLGLAIAATIAGGLLVALAVPAAAPLLADERASGLTGAALLYGVAVRIPLGTAVPEEVIFRGVLLAALHRRMRWWSAAAWSSAAFGLWHVGPTIVLARVNALDTSPASVTAVVGGAVLATAGAGLGFSLLRRWGGGLVAPVLVHSATNGFGLLAAVAHQRGLAG